MLRPTPKTHFPRLRAHFLGCPWASDTFGKLGEFVVQGVLSPTELHLLNLALNEKQNYLWLGGEHHLFCLTAARHLSQQGQVLALGHSNESENTKRNSGD